MTLDVRFVTMLAVTLGACGGSDQPATPDGSPPEDAAIADASSPDAPPPPQEVVRYDFEQPAYPGGPGPVPAGIHVEGTASVERPDVSQADPALAVGSQMLVIYGPTSITLEDLAIAQPGEEWELSMVVGTLPGIPPQMGFVDTPPQMEAVIAGETAPIAYVEDTLPTGGNFKAVSAHGVNTGPDPRVLRVQIDVQGMLLVDNLVVARKATSGQPTPFAPKLINSSFEQQELSTGGFSPQISGWLSVGTFTAVFSPGAPAHWATRPFAAPGDGVGLLELGSTSATEASDSSVTSQSFGKAVEGQTYGFTFGAGHRIDLPPCRTNEVSIITGTTVLATVSIADSELPSGSFATKTIMTAPIPALIAGEDLYVKVHVADDQTGRAQACRSELDAFKAL